MEDNMRTVSLVAIPNVAIKTQVIWVIDTSVLV